MRSRFLTCLGALFVAAIGLLVAQTQSDPWTKADLLPPARLAKTLTTRAEKQPVAIINIGFPVLYRGKHIIRSLYAGPGNKPEGIDLLKESVRKLPKDAEIVLYCGCCPWVKCPNIRPAFRALRELGYTKVRVLEIPTNFHTDWVSKNYPVELGRVDTPVEEPQK